MYCVLYCTVPGTRCPLWGTLSWSGSPSPPGWPRTTPPPDNEKDYYLPVLDYFQYLALFLSFSSFWQGDTSSKSIKGKLLSENFLEDFDLQLKMHPLFDLFNFSLHCKYSWDSVSLFAFGLLKHNIWKMMLAKNKDKVQLQVTEP